jgi:hypothetical protein
MAIEIARAGYVTGKAVLDGTEKSVVAGLAPQPGKPPDGSEPFDESLTASETTARPPPAEKEAPGLK